MSEEEKKAIEELKSRREYFEFQPEGCNWHLSFDQWETHTIIDVVINYIDKLQKVIDLMASESFARYSVGDLIYIMEQVEMCPKNFEITEEIGVEAIKKYYFKKAEEEND